MSARVTVRLPEQVAAWLAELGGDQSTTARALMVLGAATLGLTGVDREAWRLLAQEPGPRAAEALAGMADTRQPPGRQAADRRQPLTPARPPAPLASPDALPGDPLDIGIEV